LIFSILEESILFYHFEVFYVRYTLAVNFFW